MRRQSSSSSSVVGVVCAWSATLALAAELHVHAEIDGEVEHRRDVEDRRHVPEDDGLVRQEARGDDRQRRVLVPRGADGAAERPAALDHERLRDDVGEHGFGEHGIHGRGPRPERWRDLRRAILPGPMDVTRDRAWETLTLHTKSEALLRHALAVEAAVGGYARRFGEDEELWRATALLHDFDYEMHPTLDKHPQDGAPILREEGWPDEVVESVLSHAEHLAMPRDTQLKKTLFACDELAGFVHACGLVRPDGIDTLEPKSVKKKLKQPSFAAGVHRDEVYAGAELLGLELDEHIRNVVESMRPIARELGLRTAADEETP